MNIVVITADNSVPGETGIINAMFRAWLHRLHIRKPALTIAETRTFINEIDKTYHSKLVIHRHHSLYHEMNLGGIHLSSFDLAEPSLQNRLTDFNPAAISASLHSWIELEVLAFACSYIFISPVFNSISKPGYNAAIDLGELRTLKQTASTLPAVYGLGGVSKNNIATLIEKGFDGAALLGSIWQSADPVAAFLDIKAAVAQAR